LEETAIDLGTSGSDNVYGWGRIDALSAVNYSIDSMFVDSILYDLSVTGTNSQWTSIDIWVDNNDDGNPDIPQALSNNHLYARIRNIGGEVVSNVEVKFYYADVATIGISGFDPNGDGDPADGNFSYIGSYHIPTIGPRGSDHETGIALANWNIPVPPGDHWCVGVGIVAPNPPNLNEVNTSNNIAFKNFFNIVTSTTTFNFSILPNPLTLTEPFNVEIIKKNIPREAQIELIVNKALENRIMAKKKGIVRIKDPLLDPVNKPLGEKYYEILEKEINYARYLIEDDQAYLNGIISPKGEALPVKLLIRMPEKVKIQNDMLIIINTVDQKNKPLGGLTLFLTKEK
jgi:hypothetical protein